MSSEMVVGERPGADAQAHIWANHPDGSRVENVADILRRRAAATPQAPAIICGETTTTFSDLDVRSSQVARALDGAGVGRGDRVAYLGVNAPSFLEVLYGASKLGAIAVALNNRLAPAELEAILADAEPTILVMGEGERALPAANRTSLRLVVDADDYASWSAAAPGDDPGVAPGPDDPAVIFYTSGTTGAPKGIVLSGGAISQALATMHYDLGLDTTSVAMAPIPYFHISGFSLALVANLNGAALLLETETEPGALIALLVERKVSHAAVVPTLIQRMVNHPAAATADWSALHYLVYGSAPMPLPVIQKATALLGCGFVQSYGLTESTGGVTVLWPADHLPPAGREQQLLSVGRPMGGVLIRVVDPVTLAECPPGVRGEVLISGGHLMSGYWRRPDATAAAITADGWLRTGDGGSFDEQGFLYLHDRLKDMIVSGGENVFPAEVESVLTGHPAIAEVAVIGVASVEWGESPLAVVVRRPGEDLSEPELIGWVRERLAHYKCPTAVRFIDALPRNASGKVLKAALRRTYGQT